MSDRDDDRHCDTCRCDESPTWYVRRTPDATPDAKALLAWSDQMGNSQPAWHFEDRARIHPLFWYRDEDYPNEQVSYLQWGLYDEVEGDPPLFYATCFDLGDDQYECATDLEIVGAVYLLMRFPERCPEGVAPEDWGRGSDVMWEMWETHLESVGKFLPRLARYVEVVIGNHSEEYPALRIVMDEIDKGNWLEILDEADHSAEWFDEADSELSLGHLAHAIYEMCGFVLYHKWGV